jgi:hypothetical protein
VPEGQSEDILGSTETIEIDGVESKPLSKQEAKERQRRAQEKAEAKQYDWNETSRIDIAKNIGKTRVVRLFCLWDFRGHVFSGGGSGRE